MWKSAFNKRQQHLLTIKVSLEMLQCQRMSVHPQPRHAQSSMQRKPTVNEPSEKRCLSSPQEREEQTHQPVQLRSRADDDSQVLVYDRCDVRIHHLLTTFQRWILLSLFLDETCHSICHIALMFVHLEIRTKSSSEQLKRSLNPAPHHAVCWDGPASQGTEL